MLFSLNYLRTISHLEPTITNEQMIEAFNNLGFEVESVMPMIHVANVKFGKVLKTYPNPHANKLTVCEVAFADKKRIIQTTATNVVANKVVIACVENSQIGDQVFASKTMQQLPSEGMLTSSSELGIDSTLLFNSNEGISFYDEITDLTINPITYLDLNDTIIDLAILPNRADANSYYVMAHELAAYFHTAPPILESKLSQKPSDLTIKTLEDNALVGFTAPNQYHLSFVEKVLIVKSGLAVTNNIHDLTNLTFLMTGQVVHAYDRTQIGQKWTMQNIVKAEAITIDNHHIHLDSHSTIIDDGKQIINLVGIGAITALQATAASQQITFMFGQFAHVIVQRNMQVFKHVNSKIIQMSKLLNPTLMHWAYTFLTTRLQDYSQCTNLSPLKTPQPIPFTKAIINEWAGFDLTSTELYPQTLKSLTTLGFEVSEETITPPSYRFDVVLIQELLEEIFRFYNYNNFVLHQPPLLSTKISELNHVPQSLMSQGFNEVVTYLLTSTLANTFNPLNFTKPLSLIQPISQYRAEIRHSIITSFQEIALYHLKQKISNFDFFEISQINDGINVLGLCSSHRSFNDLKKVLMQTYGNIFTFKREPNQFLHPHLSAHIYYQNHFVGYIGQLNPHLFNHEILFCELLLDKINKLKINEQSNIFKIKEYDELPLKIRDINIYLKPLVSIEDSINQIKKIPGIFTVTIVDKFVSDDRIKVTIRISGNDDAIVQIDENFNQ